MTEGFLVINITPEVCSYHWLAMMTMVDRSRDFEGDFLIIIKP